MLGLVIRILVLCCVVFGVAYAITRTLRASRKSPHERIQEEIRELCAAVAARSISPEEFAERAERIRRACLLLEIEVPELPNDLEPPTKKEG